MNLTRLTVRNFRPYYGETVIDFGDGQNQPISLIHGPNGYGKTSILLAVQWCLYGAKRKRDVFEYFNTLARNELNPVMEVQAELRADSTVYTVVRRVRGKGKVRTSGDLDNDELIFLVDGERYQGQDALVVQERINELLPQNASQFAFFDGEKIEVYSSDEVSETTREAIATVLGLHLFKQAKEDAEKLVYDVGQERQRLLGRESEHARLGREIEDVERDILVARGQVEKRKGDLKQQKVIEADLQDQLSTHEGARQLIGELDRMKARRADLQATQDRLAEQMRKASEHLYLGVLRPVLTEEAGRARARAEEQTRQMQEAARQGALRELALQIKADPERRCVCGQPLDDEHFETVVQSLGISLEDIENGGVLNGSDALGLARALDEVLDSLRSRESYGALVAKFGQVENDLDEVETAVAALETRLEGSDEETIQALSEAMNRCRSTQEMLAREIGDLEGRISDLSTYRDKRETEVRRLGGQIAGLDKLTREVDVLGATALAFDHIIRDTSLARRREIEDASTAFFRSLTNKIHGYRCMTIEDDFSFAIEDSQGNRPPMQLISSGEKQVTALSFILGLNEFSQHEAPILMDTPMGRLDREHRRNVATVLRDLGRQVILLVTDTDTEFGVREILAPVIANEFEIVHDQATLTSTVQRKAI